MERRLSRALVVGLLTFIIAYVALTGFAMVRFAYYRGPIPDLLLGIPIPLIIGALAAAIVFQGTESN